MEENTIPLSTLEEFSEATVGQDILRYIGLPTILGNEKNTILYFFGRNFARQFEINQLDDLYYIFHKMNWGNFELVKEKKKQLVFHLMSDDIVKRLTSSIPIDFRMEAGFIAEVVQHIYKRSCECVEQVNDRLYLVEFKVHFTD